MACAKKCDRCGKLYEQYNSKNDRKNPNGIMVLNLDSQRRYFAHNALDLCPDCMKGFQDWFGEVKQMERLTERVYDGLIIIKQDSGDEGNYKATNKIRESVFTGSFLAQNFSNMYHNFSTDL